MSHHYIEFNSVSFTYPDGTEAIRNVSFRTSHGEAVGIIGANGAGKSTLLELVVGINLPSSGKIDVGGINVSKDTLPRIRSSCGFTFQNPDDQLFMNTVYEDVAFGPRNCGLDDRDVHAKVMDALSVVGITHLADRPPYRLSGGEKREAVIAAVLALDPNVLLLDEPSSDLDPKSRRRLISLLNGFSHTRIITSHDLDFVLLTCSRVIVLASGSVAYDGEPAGAFENDARLDEWGLERPQSLAGCPVCGRKRPA